MAEIAGPRTRAWMQRCLGGALWAATGCTGVVLTSQVVGWHGNRLLASAQALTPYLVVVLAPTAIGAVWMRRHGAAVAASLLGVGGLAVLAPIVFASDMPAAAPDAIGVEIAAVNLLYTSDRVGQVADVLTSRDADAIVFSEYTDEHHDILTDSSLVDAYPYRLPKPGPGAEGVALWSRVPFDERIGPATVNHNVDVVLDGPDGPIRLLGVHTPTPVFDFEPWVADLSTIAAAAHATPSTPTLLIGDFNASYWHPGFREILDDGFADAHLAAGEGLSASWPVGGPIPAFVRLDHALTGHGLVSTDVDDFSIPGSDHTGFEVTVAPARTAALETLARGD